LALTSRLRPPAQEAAWAIIAQCPGGSSDPGPSAQWQAIVFCSSVNLAWMSTSCLASSGSLARFRSGGANCDAEVSAKGVTLPHCGVANRCTVPPQLVAPDGGVGTHSGCHR
jgi:hypothetical protein